MYVLTSDGEKPTGGYSLEIKSITKTEPNSAYIYAVLNSPGKDDIVTQALTYPSVIVRFAKGDIQQVDWNLAPSNDVIEGEIDKSLEEMGKAISLNSVKEGKLYSLMQEELKIFTPEEAKNIIDKLNTSPTYNGPYIEMLAGNSIKIFLEDDGIIHLTSYGNEEHVIMSVQINGEYSTYCIVNSEIGRILLQDAKQRPFFDPAQEPLRK